MHLTVTGWISNPRHVFLRFLYVIYAHTHKKEEKKKKISRKIKGSVRQFNPLLSKISPFFRWMLMRSNAGISPPKRKKRKPARIHCTKGESENKETVVHNTEFQRGKFILLHKKNFFFFSFSCFFSRWVDGNIAREI